MDLQEEKRLIMEGLKDVEEEWLILAIKKLLSKESIPLHHQYILSERLEQYTSGKANMQDWESVIV